MIHYFPNLVDPDLLGYSCLDFTAAWLNVFGTSLPRIKLNTFPHVISKEMQSSKTEKMMVFAQNSEH